MSDSDMRALERAVKINPDDDVLLMRLQNAKTRVGEKLVFPSRKKLTVFERPQQRWCPVCKTWSLRKPSQKHRVYMGAPTRSCSGRLEARFSLSMDAILRTPVMPPVNPREGMVPDPRFTRAPGSPIPTSGFGPPRPPQLPPRPPIEFAATESFRVEIGFPVAPRTPRLPPFSTLCPGPARGQSCAPPLDVLEARLIEVEQWGHEEISWFKHRIKVEKEKLVRAGLRELDPPPTHECRGSNLDYTDGDRAKVSCSVCGTNYVIQRNGDLKKEEAT